MTEKQKNMLKRAQKHALLFIKRGATIRSVAKETGYSKSTVQLDLHRIQDEYPQLHKKALEKVNLHKQVAPIRGGEATRLKYANEKEGI